MKHVETAISKLHTWQYIVSLCLLVTFCFASPSLAARKALLISSYHPGFPTFFQQIDGIKSILQPQGIQLDVEFMDSKRFFSEESISRFHKLLKFKLDSTEKYSVIITSDDNALNYIIENRQELFPNVPIVFCGVNNQTKARSLESNPDFTGVIESVSIEETLNLMWLLRPRTQKVYAITDSTPSGQSDSRAYLELAKKFPNKELHLLSLAESTWQELGATLSTIPQRDAILLLSAYRDKTDSKKLFEDGLEYILKFARAPVYHLWEHGLEQGLLGGKVISHFEQGRIAGSLALEILNGRPASDLEIVEGTHANRYTVDYPVLKHFGINTELLPKGTHILNEPDSGYLEYKIEISFIIVSLVILVTIAVVLLFMVVKLRESRAVIEASDNKHRVLFEKSPLGMILFDDHGLIVDCNENFVKLMGSPKQKLIGFNTALQSTPEMQVVIARALSGEVSVYEGEYTSITGNKTTYLRVVFNPVHAGHKPTPVIATLEDFSERRKAEEAIILANEQLKEANKFKSEFLANMSHEIRTPINGIMGMLQLVEKSQLDSSQDEYIRSAIQSTRRLNRLLSDIMDITKVEAGKLRVIDEPFNLHDTVHQVVELFQISSKQTGIALHASIDPDIPKYLIGDGARLQQILNNLVGNSFKFTSEGQITIEANSLSDEFTGQYRVLFSISDTGIGIPAEKVTLLFESFRQASDGYKRKYQGAGLGLSICKHLVSLMGGHIAVDSVTGQGTTIHFSLPFTPTHAPVEEQPRLTARPILPSDLRVLLVEDDRVNRLAASRMLEKLGVEALTARNGVEAIKALKTNDVDLVLLDIQMPLMDGIEATKRIREGEAGSEKANVTIIALTAYAMAGDRQEILSAGMDECLTKPVEFDRLRDILSKFSG